MSSPPVAPESAGRAPLAACDTRIIAVVCAGHLLAHVERRLGPATS